LPQTLEKKFFDATFAFSAGTAAGQFPSSDGWIEDLSDMTQGVGITQRVGDRIAPTSLEFRWLIFTPNAAGLITGLFFRMVIFIWTADGTPTIGDILTSGTTPFENLISPFTHNTKENRKILFDQTILLFDSFSSAVRTTNNNSTGKVVIPLGKFQNKWGPVIGNLHKLWKRNSLMQHLLLALELQQGNSQALMDGLKIYLI